jgi:hypothetical protein
MTVANFNSVRQLLNRKKVAQFRKAVKPDGHLETTFVELFVQSRFRPYVLAYLTVQEGEPFEGEAGYDTNAPKLIDGLLRSIGTDSLLTLRPGIGSFRFDFCLDPLVSLRKLYAMEFVPCGGRVLILKWISKFVLLRQFRAKCLIIRLVLSCYGRFYLGRQTTPEWINTAVQSPNGRRLVALLLLFLFPCAREFSKAEWDHVFSAITGYFGQRIPELLSVIPAKSIESNGLIKLAKVFFGTLVGSSAGRGRWQVDNVNFVVNSLRLAYSWGITYPLVDNLLDSDDTSDALRTEICQTLHAVFEGGEADSATQDETLSAEVRQLKERLTEVVQLIPESNRARARSLLIQLLDVHRRDSMRRLDHDANAIDIPEVLADTVQKASLVRLATMEICGITTGADVVQRCEERGLFNQYGDDLWDIYEDFEENRITPFTLYLTKGLGENPFRYYVACTLKLTSNMSRYRKMAALMGCAESFRDLTLSLARTDRDVLKVSRHIQEVLTEQGVDNIDEFLAAVPHVDFDAVLFEAERAVIDGIRRGLTRN